MRKKTDQNLLKWHKWGNDISYLSSEVLNLQLDMRSPISAISKFLLMCQLIEFQLKELLMSLGFSRWLKFNLDDYISDPADFDKMRFTLGILISELEKYKYVRGVKRLKKRLYHLLIKRNQFTHRLFSYSLVVKKLFPLSNQGIVLGELVLSDILSLNERINDEQDKYFKKIKRLKNGTEKEKLLSSIWIGKVKSNN